MKHLFSFVLLITFLMGETWKVMCRAILERLINDAGSLWEQQPRTCDYAWRTKTMGPIS